MSDAAYESSDAPRTVERLLRDAIARRASDLHLEPTVEGLEARCRVDGLLQTVGQFDRETGRALVGRLMVLARLLTYRLDVPQEGRLNLQRSPDAPPLELRLAIMPTLHGLRAAVRLPADLLQPRCLEDLRLPPEALEGLRRFASADSGMLLLTGPAGSGKTTTIYALLQHIQQHSPGLSLVTLEDPVERDLPGVTQIEVTPFGELTYEKALRSILRQDPQVLMLGEIRDAATATLAVQAALSGHRLVSTLHAASAGGAVARLLEMNLEPYQITSALFAVVCQRLVRQRGPSGVYQGRLPLVEWTPLDGAMRRGVLERADADALEALAAAQPGHRSLRHAASDLVAAGLTDEAEVLRVLGSNGA